MSQADYIVSNGTGASVRSDLNGQLAAIVSNNSGSTEPATMYAYQWWPDTTSGLLKQRNAANSAWITIGTLASTNLGLLSLAGGTMTGVVAAAAGTAALPGIAFTGDLNTGVLSPGADQVAISTGGTNRLAISTTAVSSTLAVDVPLGAVGTPSLTFTGDLNTGIWSPAADTIAFSEGGAEAMRIDSSSRLLIGTSTGQTLAGNSSSAKIQSGADSDYGGIAIVSSIPTAIYPSHLTFAKTRGATTSSRTTVNNGDEIGLISFQGADGSNFIRLAGISGEVDGAPGANDMPGRLVFSTTADGGSSPTEAMRINSQQELLVGTGTRNANGGVLQLKSGITFPATAVAASDANTLDDYEEGTWTGTMTGLTTAPTTPITATGKYTKIGNIVTIHIMFFERNTTGASGQIVVTGLPFLSFNSNQVGSVNTQGLSIPNKTLNSWISGLTTTIELFSAVDNATGSFPNITAGASKTLLINASYFV